MNLVKVENNVELADQAALFTFNKLKAKVEQSGEAIWVLSGGTSPSEAYSVIVQNYAAELVWQKVWFLIGDERHVPLEDVDSNWTQVNEALLKRLARDNNKTLTPIYDSDLGQMAKNYAEQLSSLPKGQNDLPILDLVWLGLGEDGHTLSLFPGHDLDTSELVVAVLDSPKPPSERISLSLKAVQNTDTCLILAAGEAKAEAVKRLMANDINLPITKVVQAIEAAGGQVTLLVDELAGSLV